jgi:hypothetical protein
VIARFAHLPGDSFGLRFTFAFGEVTVPILPQDRSTADSRN